jgi:hypothetical protein
VAERTGGWVARYAIAGVALAFLLVGLATFGDHGLTWDGPESYLAGERNLEIVGAALAGEPAPPWPWHELPGYQFVVDTARAAFARAANATFWQPGSYRGFHLANLLLATLAVGLTGRLAARESGVAALGPLAATLLAVQPELVGHSVGNPKDVPGLVVWLLGALAATRAARHGRAVDFALLGGALGLALATHAAAVLLLPLTLVWVMGAGAGTLARRLAGLALAAGVTGATGLLCSPWLWAAPLRRALYLVRHVGSFDVDMKVLYLGRTWAPTELPWHYGLASLAIATPALVLAAAGGGMVVAARRAASRQRAPARLCRLAMLWLGLVVAADIMSPARYDGSRHLLPALPALALLAAAGIWAAWAARPSSRGARLAAAGFAAWLVVHALSLAAIHPYADAWLSPLARLAFGPEAQRHVELEVWGASYAEGCTWLVDNAPDDARVLVPFASHVAAPCLAGRFELVPHDAHADTSRPRYLMLMAREAWYTPRLREVVATRRPVFTIRRQGSTLLAIYRL